MIIKTFESNDFEISVEAAEKEGLELGEILHKKVWAPAKGNRRVYSEWKKLFPLRNKSYGIKTWKDLGLRGIFAFLYAKYQRYSSILEYDRKLDSYADTFGYCVLASIYLKAFGVDFSKITPQKYGTDGLSSMLKYFWLDDEIDVDHAAQLVVDYLHHVATETFVTNPKNIIPLNSRG